MNVKNKAEAEARWSQVQSLGRGVREVGRHVWLASLGAVETLDETSRELFSELVERGQRFENRERPALEKRFHEVGRRLGRLRSEVEENVSQRLSKSLQRFGVPDRTEVRQLIDRIERLTRKVEGMTTQAGA